MKKKMIKITRFYLMQDFCTISDIPDYWVMKGETLIKPESVEKEIDKILGDLRADHHYSRYNKVIIYRTKSPFNENIEEIKIDFFHKEFADHNEHYLIRIERL
jgi:hypothetical protein